MQVVLAWIFPAASASLPSAVALLDPEGTILPSARSTRLLWLIGRVRGQHRLHAAAIRLAWVKPGSMSGCRWHECDKTYCIPPLPERPFRLWRSAV